MVWLFDIDMCVMEKCVCNLLGSGLIVVICIFVEEVVEGVDIIIICIVDK